ARLLPYARPIAPAAELSGLRLRDAFKQRLEALVRRDDNLICYLQGPYGVGKQTTAEALCRAAGQGLLVVGGERRAGVGGEEFATLARLADREARLQGAALYWDGFDALLADLATHSTGPSAVSGGASGQAGSGQADPQAQREALLDVLA